GGVYLWRILVERSLSAASADGEEEIDNDQACTCYRIPDGCHNVCPGSIVGNGAAHRTHASELAPLPSRTMLVGGRQARLPAKGKGDPKASAFGIPLRTWGAGRGGPRAPNRYFYFFCLASPLAVVPQAARAVSHGRRANIARQT